MLMLDFAKMATHTRAAGLMPRCRAVVDYAAAAMLCRDAHDDAMLRPPF